MPCQHTHSVGGHIKPAPSRKKAWVLHLHHHAEQHGAVVGSPRKGQRDRVRLGDSEGIPHHEGGQTLAVGQPPSLETLIQCQHWPCLGLASEVSWSSPSLWDEDGMVGKVGGQPCSQPQKATVPSPSPIVWAGEGSGRGRVSRWMARATPALSEGTFPTQQAHSPEREKEKAEGLGKEKPGSVDNASERLSHRDCF